MNTFVTSVIGAGGLTGVATVYDQALFGETKRINLFDPKWAEWDNLHKDIKRFEKLLGEHFEKLNFYDEMREEFWTTADAAISCAPHAANAELTEKALEYEVPYCDLGGCPEVVAEQAKLSQNASSPVVPDCGLSPGLAQILAVHLARAGCKDIYMRCGCNPTPRPDKRENPLLYKVLYSPEGTASGYCGKTNVIRNGAIVSVPTLSAREEYNCEFEADLTSHHSEFVTEHLHSLGVRECSYKTLRYRGHYQQLEDDGWRYDSDPLKLAAYLRGKPELVFDRKRDRDRTTLDVGSANGSHVKHQYNVRFNERLGFTAIEIMTAIGISAVAHHMSSGLGRPKAFSTPEGFVNSGWIIAEVSRRLEHYRA